MAMPTAGPPARPFAAPGLPWSWRVDGAAAAVAAAATVALRLASASRTLYTVDSVLFALATQRYDLMSLRPHPPGYPLFVALGKLLLPLAADHNQAFVLQSALWSGLAVALLYALLRAWGSRRAAVVGATLFAAAPAFAFNGTVALSYTAEAAAMVGVALLAWHVRARPRPALLLALGAAWALAVGIRQSLLPFLAPVVLVALWGPLRRPEVPALARRTAVCAAAALATALAWFLPMAWASGGIAAVRRATALQSSQVVFADAVWVRGWPALAEHAGRLAYFLHWEAGSLLPWAAATALVGAAVHGRRAAAGEPPAWPAGAGVLLAAWLLPATAFYLLVFDGWERGPIGYVLTLLPGLYAMAVLLADQGLRRLAAAQPPRLARLLGTLALPLLLVPLPILAQDAAELHEREVEAHDRWAADWQQIDAEYPPESTAILAWQSWSHVKWHFPDHLAWTYFPTYSVEGKRDWALLFAMRHHEDEEPFIAMATGDPDRPHHPIPPWVRTIVVFDFQLCGEGGEVRRLAPSVEVEEARFANGARLLVLHPDPATHPTVESLFTPEALGDGARAPRQPEVEGAPSPCVARPAAP